jgi:hypothetical protein
MVVEEKKYMSPVIGMCIVIMVGQGRSRPPRISDEAAIMAMMGTRLYKADTQC